MSIFESDRSIESAQAADELHAMKVLGGAALNLEYRLYTYLELARSLKLAEIDASKGFHIKVTPLGSEQSLIVQVMDNDPIYYDREYWRLASEDERLGILVEDPLQPGAWAFEGRSIGHDPDSKDATVWVYGSEPDGRPTRILCDNNVRCDQEADQL